MRNILVIIAVVLVAWFVSLSLRKDTYIGFYYPDATNLANDIQSPVVFDSLTACRDWINKQVSERNTGNSNYDYECGKNCDTSQGKPYVCEETLE